MRPKAKLERFKLEGVYTVCFMKLDSTDVDSPKSEDKLAQILKMLQVLNGGVREQ